MQIINMQRAIQIECGGSTPVFLTVFMDLWVMRALLRILDQVARNQSAIHPQIIPLFA